MKNLFNLVFIFIFIFSIGCEPEEKIKITIISPSNTQTISSQNQAQILAKTEPPIDITKKINVKIEYSKVDKTTTIAEGDIRSFSALDRIEAFWDISDVPEGEYVIKVSMEGAISDEVTVTIHRPPNVDIGLYSVEPSPEGTQVQLYAIVDTINNTPIEKYIWTAGDNSNPIETDSPVFIHDYPKGDTFLVWLEVQDALGGVTLITRDLFLFQDDGKIKRTTDCGCRSMTVTATRGGNTGTYCVPTVVMRGKRVVHPDNLAELTKYGCNAIGGVGAGGCPANHVPFNCPLGQRIPGVNQPYLTYSYEVKADLTANTNDITQCPEGQYARATVKLNGFLLPLAAVKIPPPAGAQTLPNGGGAAPFRFTAVGKGNSYPPFAGPKYGSNDRAAPSGGKRHLPTTIRWMDIVGYTITPNANSFERKYETIAFVRGNPTCWCRFKMIQNWTRANGAAPGNKIEILAGLNCKAGAGVVDNR